MRYTAVMLASCPRWIVRRAVLASVGVVLLALVWLILREPPEIERSRGIKLRMIPLEVEAVMQADSHSGVRLRDGRELWMYGAAGLSKGRLIHTLNQWLGTSMSTSYKDMPVRVRFDKDWRVDRIERGDEVEEVPQP